jgi:hypothetical protein
MPYAVTLNSRQSKTPVGNNPWVSSTLRAVHHAADRGYTIIGSLGLNTWELVTWAAGNYGGRLLIYIPHPYHKNIGCEESSRTGDKRGFAGKILKDFDLDPSRTEFHFQEPPIPAKTKKSAWPARDKEIIDRADTVFPISIRPGGNLAALIAQVGSGKKIRADFCVPYQRAKKHAPIIPDGLAVSDKLSDNSWPYITHWTRAANGKWPGETAASYYRDLAQSGDLYPRSGLATLQRIIHERRLRASTRNIRGGFPVVSFSALHPGEAVKLMRWRKRYVRWSFEPYGIGINKDSALSRGVRPVIYGTPENYAPLPEADRPFFQNPGVRGGDWKPENEWRHLGDLDLDAASADELVIIVRSPEEKTRVESATDIEVLPLFD